MLRIRDHPVYPGRFYQKYCFQRGLTGRSDSVYSAMMENKNTHRVMLLLSDDELRTLSHLAHDDERTVSKMANRYVKAWLKTESERLRPQSGGFDSLFAQAQAKK